MLPWARFSVHTVAKDWKVSLHQITPISHYDFIPFQMKRYWKNPLNSNSCIFRYTKPTKCWDCRVILSMKVNINSMKLKNNYQSSLSSLSASLKKMFFVRKKALAEWSWLKLLTSLLINSYPEFSRDSSFLPVRHNSSRNNKYALSIYCGGRSAVMWNSKLC